MTKADKKALGDILARLDEFYSLIDGIREKDQVEYDLRSERWQDSERGEAFYDQIDALENTVSSINDARDYLREVV